MLLAQMSSITEPKDLDAFFSGSGLLQTFVNILIGLPLIIFPLVIIYGGFMYMIAAGNDQNIQKAKTTITWGIVGFIITMVAYTLVILLTKIFGSNGFNPTVLPKPSF